MTSAHHPRRQSRQLGRTPANLGARRGIWLALLAPVTAFAGDAPSGATVLQEPLGGEGDVDGWLSEGAFPEAPAPLPGAPKDAPPGTERRPYVRSEGRGDGASGASFTPDRDTRRPGDLAYEDPFTPRVTPFKRLASFDSIDANYILHVHRAASERVPLSPAPATADEDTFYGDLTVELSRTGPVRIPTPGPGARLLAARATNAGAMVPVTITTDSAENWFVSSTENVRARLVFSVAVSRAAFGGVFPEDRPAAHLRPIALPPNVAADAADVARAIGVDSTLSFREQVARLAAYFRSFSESDKPLRVSEGIYKDLALGKQGVCRHRAFAFFVTARYLGIPTRLVSNEAHAWVEVHDGVRFRRVDLGGAGQALEQNAGTQAPPHAPPEDPFSWPAGATRGADLGTPSTRPSGGESSGTVAPLPARGERDRRPPTALTLNIVPVDNRGGSPLPAVTRGDPLTFAGTARAGGRTPCSALTVRILWASAATHERFLIGDLVTGADGAFRGTLAVPSKLPRGTGDLFAETVGDAACGLGTSAP